jgi:predicted dehydrogenase
MVGLGLSIEGSAANFLGKNMQSKATRVGMIGLDTSHCIAFTKLLNASDVAPDLARHHVVTAYPWGSRNIESSKSRIPEYTEEIEKLGVKIVDSIAELLEQVDVILLETNDGNLHLEQALQVFKSGKPLFIDKPIAASYSDAKAIFKAAKKYNVPVFSSSSLRYTKNAQEIRRDNSIGKVLGADAYSPAKLEETHPDLFWYGIHGVELLYTVMGTGCKSVSRTHTKDSDVVVGVWHDGRIGTFRGARSGKIGFGGTAFGEKGNAQMGPYDGYRPLLVQIVSFFRTGIAPVNPQETLEIYAFMEAADESKRNGGKSILIETI